MRRLAIIAALAAGCAGGAGTGGGTGGGSGGGGAAAFLGSWTISGNSNVTMGASTMPFSGALGRSKYNVAFSVGGTRDVVSLDNFGCKLEWTLEGQSLKLAVPQTCMASGFPIDVQVSTLELTPINANSLSGGGSLSGQCMGGPCSADGAGTFTRLP